MTSRTQQPSAPKERSTVLLSGPGRSATPAILPRDYPMLKRGLRLLAGMDGDNARELNGEGFNKLDTRIGHELAQRNYLSPKQGVVAVRLLNKYRRQLPEDINKRIKELMK